jgi:hypothetical protein
MLKEDEATFEQLLYGHPVGVEGDVFCTSCDDHLEAGERVEVYAYRLSGRAGWSVPRLLCEDCAWGGLIETLGAIELLATADLGTLSNPAQQTHTAVLVSPEVERMSPPTTGNDP